MFKETVVVELGFTFGYALGKKILCITRPSAKPDVEEALKIAGYFAAGRATREMAVKQGDTGFYCA